MDMQPVSPSTNSNAPLENGIKARLGVVPNFFRLAAKDATIAANLWGFARFAYLDNPLPSLFKERLFVYLSLFCDVRYCIARHLGFLVGLGNPSGDPACLPQTIEEVLPLLLWVLPRGEAVTPLLTACKRLPTPLSSYPAPDTLEERALFACATHVFLQSPDAPRAHHALRLALDPQHLEHLNVFLSFVRTAHFWTKLHPELSFEEDLNQLFNAHEVLAACVLKQPEAYTRDLGRRVAAELESLEKLKRQNTNITNAYKALNRDHEYITQSLQTRETNLRELVSAMPAAVFACDEDGSIVYCNRLAIELWGCEPPLDGRPWSFLDSLRLYVEGIRLAPEHTPLRQVLATGRPVVNQQLVMERPDSTRISVLANIAPLRDARGIICGAVNIIQDITKIKSREQQREELLHELERSNHELSQFSFAVSHDLQGPVRSVRALTRLLVGREEAPSEEASHLAALIEQASERMEHLIESMLRYAQVGQGQLNRTRLSINAVIDAVRLSLGALIDATKTRIICRRLPEIVADPIQIQQVFENLVTNAIKFHTPGTSPVIEIQAEVAEEEWVIAVADNGQGVPPEHHHVVFEPLKRLHGGDIPGAGLGLAMCRAIVLRHGGRIWVESKGAGQGARFCFTLSQKALQSKAIVETVSEHYTARAGLA